MARIFYGVAGVGFGHSSRSELIGKYLLEQGHDVVFFGSMQSLQYLSQRFPGRVTEITGLHLTYRNGKLDLLHTLFSNLFKMPKLLEQITGAAELNRFKPDLIISDYEPCLVQWAKKLKVPCLVIDHQSVITHLKLDYIPGTFFSKLIAKLVTKCYYHGVKHFVALSFFKEKVKTKNCTLAPPVLRRQVEQFRARQGNYLLYYTTDQNSPEKFTELFQRFPEIDFYIYGLNQQYQLGNCYFKKTATEEFLKDLAGCRGVIATAGFSLISECLYYRKKMFLIPIQGQFEQELNSHYIEKYKFGISLKQLDQEGLTSFINSLAAAPVQAKLILEPDNRRFFTILNHKINTLLPPKNNETSCQTIILPA